LPESADYEMNLSPWNPLTPFVLLWRHRDLLDQFTRRTIEQRHKGSALGLLWAVLNPLLLLLLYSFVFGHVMGVKFHRIPNETDYDYPLGLFLGLVFYQFLAEILTLSPIAIVTQPNFVKKVVFPLEILPVATVGASAFTAAISLGLALLGVLLFGGGLHLHAFWLLAIIPPIGLIGLGCAWFLSAFGVFVRDTANAMPFLSQVLIYTSSVFFSLALMQSSKAWWILRLNPLLWAVEESRCAVLWRLPISTKSLVFLWMSGIVISFFGYLFFHKTRPGFADVL
jgi:lipopolysaccharide transport system permease protein